jgi:hypothetical protein
MVLIMNADWDYPKILQHTDMFIGMSVKHFFDQRLKRLCVHMCVMNKMPEKANVVIFLYAL